MTKQNTPILIALGILLVLSSALILTGCSEDDPVTPPTPGVGTVIVNSSPENLGSTWILTPPSGHNIQGNATTNLLDMPTGSYSLTWQPVTNYQTPTPATTTQVLAADSTVTFTGSYFINNPDMAVLIINPEPNGINTYWLRSWEDQVGGIRGSGDDTTSYQIPGTYTIYWGDVPGWITPDSTRLMATSPDTTIYTGTYTVDYAAYPEVFTNWYYDDALVPQGYPMLIGAGANDEQDGYLPPDAFIWISDLDGVVADSESTILTSSLSLGQHQIRVRAEDSHGLVSEDTISVHIVPVPAQSPTAAIILPDWGDYVVAQPFANPHLLGWDGTDPASASGNPAYVRFLFTKALLQDGSTYAQTKEQVEANLDFLISETDEMWSNWRPFLENELDRRIAFSVPRLDSNSQVIHYLFIVQPWSETGAINSELIYAGNVAHFFIQE